MEDEGCGDVGWDSYFMSLVYAVAMKSKDENTHIGAVVVGPKNEIRTTGYNSFPRRINDYVADRQKKPEKYNWFVHAERNAIYNAARIGTPLEGCRMYTNGVPCVDCAHGVIQSGIIEVIVDKEWNDDNSEKWAESAKKSLKQFDESGVSVRYFEKGILGIHKFRQGKVIKVD